MNKTLKTIILIIAILGFLLLSVSVSYYFFIFVPKNEQAKIELQKQEQAKKEKERFEQRKIEFDRCLQEAMNEWERTHKGEPMKFDTSGHVIGMKDQHCYDEYPEQH